MTTIYHAYTEEIGEVEGMFNQAGELIGMWSCNDASWRNEYFSGFLHRLGIEVLDAPRELQEKLVKAALDLWG